MRLINFGKPLDSATLRLIQLDLGEMPEIVESAYALSDRPLPDQAHALVAALALDPRENYVVVLPDHPIFAALLVAAIRHAHGHYPWVATWESGSLEVYALSALYPNKRENR